MLWGMISELKRHTTLDYLQIFEFSVDKSVGGEMVQKITHKQEQPEVSRTYEFPLGNTKVVEKVYVIDDGEQCTMLWADEY